MYLINNHLLDFSKYTTFQKLYLWNMVLFHPLWILYLFILDIFLANVVHCQDGYI